ncbi:MAG TPA: outer membrane beta-barrel protein [Gammaproteobacteria bacterium]|jgi:hypothetical protein|nr:outer membrane beta-barrel protein [Gammaproteobacteria bacterium]
MRNTQILAITLTSLSLLAIASPARAELSLPYGWYVEGNVGSTHLSKKNYPGDSSSSGIGGNANIGYKFMPYIAAEIGYTRYANTTVKDQFGTKAGTDKIFSADFAVKGILPIGGSGAELFAKLGVDRVYSNMHINNQTAANNIGLGHSDHSATGVYLGAGAQYSFVPEFAANIQWARANGSSSTGTMDFFSFGLAYILY